MRPAPQLATLPAPAGSRSLLLSATLHAAALCLILATFHLAPPALAPAHLPGTAAGSRIMLSYQAGAPAANSVLARAKAPVLPRFRPSPVRRPTPAAPPLAAAPAGISGFGSTGEASFGDDDLKIALVQFHPRPAPDLSALASGGSGDEVLDAVIDAQGHIAKLSITHSLGAAIDKTVLATVATWTFTPASRRGVPTASEQEILFHYERS